MPIIVFEDDGIEEEVESGQLLQDVIDACGADIIFGCREGGCATCMIEVPEGIDALSPPSHAEQSTLEPDELETGFRLSCQVTITGEGRIVIRSAGL